jgi:hypothetical protein
MRNTSDRKKKPEIRWDSEANSAWWNDKSVSFTEDQQRQLLKICNEPEFIQAIERLGGQYLSREKPRVAPVPKPGGIDRSLDEYRARWVLPSQNDIERTLKDLLKTKNKAQKLGETSGAHPVWETMENAWYAEHKELLRDGFFDQLRYLDEFHFMLETTPDDHPDKPRMQAIWDNDHKFDFEKWNNEIIPNLVELSLKHLKSVYSTRRINNPEHKRWLAWRLAYVLHQFGIKLTQTKGGPLSLCLHVVLEAAGQSDGGKSVHNFIKDVWEGIEHIKNQPL